MDCILCNKPTTLLYRGNSLCRTHVDSVSKEQAVLKEKDRLEQEVWMMKLERERKQSARDQKRYTGIMTGVFLAYVALAVALLFVR